MGSRVPKTWQQEQAIYSLPFRGKSRCLRKNTPGDKCNKKIVEFHRFSFLQNPGINITPDCYILISIG